MKVIVETTLSLTERLNKFLIKLLFFAIFQATYCRFLLEECYRSCMWRLVESFTRLKLSAPMASRLLKVLERVQQQQQPSRLRLAGNNKLFESIRLPLVSLNNELIRDNFNRKFYEQKAQGADFRIRPSVEFRFRPKEANNLADQRLGELSTETSKTLLVLVGWVGARSLDRWADYWHRRGFDVLRIEMRVIDILFPMQTSRPKALLLTQLLDELRHVYPGILFHTFSSGSFLFGGMVKNIMENHSAYGHLPQHLVGAILDSVPEWDRSIEEFCRNAFEKHSKWFARNATELFLAHTNQHNKDLNFSSELKTVAQNPLHLPMLFLLSSQDPYSNADWVKKVEQDMVTQNIPVGVKCWSNSDHVRHYSMNRAEYEMLTDRFVSQALLNADKLREGDIEELFEMPEVDML